MTKTKYTKPILENIEVRARVLTGASNELKLNSRNTQSKGASLAASRESRWEDEE